MNMQGPSNQTQQQLQRTQQHTLSTNQNPGNEIRARAGYDGTFNESWVCSIQECKDLRENLGHSKYVFTSINKIENVDDNLSD